MGKTKEAMNGQTDCDCGHPKASGCVRLEVHADLRAGTLDVKMDSGCEQAPVGQEAPKAIIPLAAWNKQSGGDTYQVIFNGKVYENAWWVDATHCPGEAAANDPNNPWRQKRTATAAEIAEHGNPTSCDLTPPPDGELTKDDAQTLAGYTKVGYSRDGTGTNLSYTSTRVANPVYNTYTESPSKPKVAAYLTDWGQYDGRLDKPAADLPAKDYGRGFDLSLIPVKAYDRLIFSFLGVFGQERHNPPGETDIADSIRDHANGGNIAQPGHVTVVDAWGDLGSYRNCGLTVGNGSVSKDNWIGFFEEGKAAGLLGGLKKLKEDAAAAGHTLELAFSIGGWSMSSYFTKMAADAAQRKTFVDSVIWIFEKFPMFHAVDIDWEYPGGGGLVEDAWSEADGANFALLIDELRKAMNGLPNGASKEITIAAACDVAKLKKSNIPELLAKGLNNIYLMAYDFFGFSWAERLAHHTNLKAAEGMPFSAEAAVDYLVDEAGVDPKHLHMGYANYGRAAAEANPDTGSHNKTGAALGSFEAGAVEFFDSIFNHIDFTKSPPEGKHGFKLYTDPNVDADYLYSDAARSFISLDTTRTVKAKAEYALRKGLGGMFSWAADQDNGLLFNAAREGLGYVLSGTAKFDMAPTYKVGESRPLGTGTKKKA
ncbi:MAG: chitinase [Myxococcaceae bacterium]|nr:MAG: chitinase [Myxococcaceae bacterium]